MLIKAIIEGMLGAILFLAFRSWRRDFEFTNKLKQRIICRIIMGGIVGYIWLKAGMPNSFNTIMAGALAPEMAEGFFERFKEKYDKMINEEG